MNFCYLQCLENISHTHTHTFGWSAKVGQERAWDSAFFQKVEMVTSATLHECTGISLAKVQRDPGRHPVVSSVNAVAVLGVIHRDINCLRSSEVCLCSKNCNAGCECSRMLPALNSVAQSDTHSRN